MRRVEGYDSLTIEESGMDPGGVCPACAEVKFRTTATVVFWPHSDPDAWPVCWACAAGEAEQREIDRMVAA